MERCPNCSARTSDAEVCRRCGMDLGLLIAAEQAAEQALARGIRGLARDDLGAARRDLVRSLALRRSQLAEHLLQLATQRIAERAGGTPASQGATSEPIRPALDDTWPNKTDPPIFDLVTPLCGPPREERLPPKTV
ncbi:hypothetical protein [Thiocystis violacea]|uniref:hypothetical protein n=1 Tax=Thiocystis violacea TaxID=13725 RepID=UPI00190727FD|nr:hypothetical protein [Thiocystis violacea]MBK1722192.1 hypothetical protein [Thiocystis violacea]